MDAETLLKTRYPGNYSQALFTDEPEDLNNLKTPLPPHTPVAFPWSPDQRDGTYKNPILCADYSDPDICRAGDDYFMTASSFSCVPGLPILHSKDLVNWKLIGHAFHRYLEDFDIPRHACGIWAPAIRYHNGTFYIFVGDPDNGIFMTKTKDPFQSPWEPLHLVRKARGWIDCCPFWDEDGSAYLVNAFSRSRAGFRNVLHLHKMSPDGTSIDDGVEIVGGYRSPPPHPPKTTHPDQYTVVEGPKMYKRNGYYYILAPGGGVSHGYQLAFRSKNIFGPYESKIVLDRGSTPVNGPHQGGWVTTPTGEDWFVHFQELLPYGRVVHLQPMKWIEDWPLIGIDYKKTGRGEPVMQHKKPVVQRRRATDIVPEVSLEVQTPQTSDDFDAPTMGLQWQWWANYKEQWYSLEARPGQLRLYPVPPTDHPDLTPTAADLMYNRPNLVLQKFPAEIFKATARLDLSHLAAGEKAGLVLAGKTMVAIHCERTGDGVGLTRTHFSLTDQAFSTDVVEASATLPTAGQGEAIVYLQLAVEPGGICTLSYGVDGDAFIPLGKPIAAVNAQWIGAKVGFFANVARGAVPRGYADFDYLRFSP